MNTRHQPAVSYRRFVLLATIFAIAFVCYVPHVSAQFRRNRVELERRARNDDQMREVEIKRLESGLNKKPSVVPAPTLPYLQIREDFRQLQIVHNEMMVAAFSGPALEALNYKGISKATAEINKRAARLKSTLQLPKPQNEVTEGLREITNDEQARVSLLDLDSVIMKFVLNPSFGHAGVVDAQESARASQDLLRIIELSRHIKQHSARLAGSKN